MPFRCVGITTLIIPMLAGNAGSCSWRKVVIGEGTKFGQSWYRYQDNIVMANLNFSNFSVSALSMNESGSNPLNPWIWVKTYAFTFWNARRKRSSFLPEDISSS